ncbi:MAG: HAD family phosphatase [Treponema sp.]|jgi:HAD superfamily hydrolase (TIGR01509 family)|nr:HAD family phosphatase [Treponema sp.]
MKKIEIVLFDMDGIILDTEAVCRRTWSSAGTEYRMPEWEESFNACIGCNKNDTRLFLEKKYGGDFPVSEFMQRTSALFHQIEKNEGLPLMKGVIASLEYLQQEKYRIALASSTRRPVVERQLKRAGVFDYFETITTGDLVEHSKPAPDIYLLACESLSAAPENCAAVEDSPNGILSACSAGLKCIMVPDQVRPDPRIKALLWGCLESLEQLPDFLKSNNR